MSDSEVSCDPQMCIPCLKRIGALRLPIPAPLGEALALEHVSTLMACTVNICPDKFLNKKRWKTYTHEEQRKILFRIERSMRTKTPSVKLHKLIYEVCPQLNQIHFHALYECPTIYESTINNFWRDKKYNPSDDWRICETKPIFNYDGWFKYIHKDQFTHTQ